MTPTFFKSALVAVALMGSATMASAMSDHIYLDTYQKTNSFIVINSIATTSDGVIEVRALNNGEPGRLLASYPLKKGTYPEFKIEFVVPTVTDVAVQLINNNDILLDTEIVQIDD